MQPELVIILFSIIALVFSIVLHEVAHGYAAKALGDQTAKLAGRLTLNPLKHIDPVGSIILPAFLVIANTGLLFGWAKPVPYNPYNLKNQRWGEAFVASAGSLTNITLAFIFAVIARSADTAGLGAFADLASIVVLINLFLGFFNLIPVPPLDGYTVLRGLLPYRFSVGLRSFEEQVRRGGIFTLIAFLFVFAYLLAPPFISFIFLVYRLLMGA